MYDDTPFEPFGNAEPYAPSFHERLMFFAQEYGYKDEGMDDLVERSEKRLISTPEVIQNIQNIWGDPNEPISNEDKVTPEDFQQVANLLNNPPPEIGRSISNEAKKPIPRKGSQPLTPLQQQRQSSISNEENVEPPGNQKKTIDVTVNVRLRNKPGMMKNFPENFREVFEKYKIKIFGDVYTITSIRNKRCTLDRIIPRDTFNKNIKNVSQNSHVIEKPATLIPK